MRKRAEFLAVQRKGRKIQGEHFLMLLLPQSAARVGITVSGKVGGAVVRNRTRRWVREYVRRHRREVPLADVVLVARPSAAQADHDAVDRDLEALFGRVAGRGGR